MRRTMRHKFISRVAMKHLSYKTMWDQVLDPHEPHKTRFYKYFQE